MIHRHHFVVGYKVLYGWNGRAHKSNHNPEELHKSYYRLASYGRNHQPRYHDSNQRPRRNGMSNQMSEPL
jgi:hypothetical protein